MNTLVLDLHLHSRFSRAVSNKINLDTLYLWGKMKGIHVLSASDVTHPVWFTEIESKLIEQNEGVYTLKDKVKVESEYGQYFQRTSLNPRFILSTELSLIYSEFGKGRRVHVIVCFPSLEVVKKVSKMLVSRGFNLSSDGRPILGISLRDLCEALFTIDPCIVIIPAHVWTPWFGVYGSKSGYISLEEAFGEYASHIFAVESGLSSDPLMNWQVDELNTRSIVSFSDAHSLAKIGREATVLKKWKMRHDEVGSTLGVENGELKIENEDITYKNIINGMKKDSQGPFKMAYTIEFYPEEGKYHHTGHRNCKVRLTPGQTKQQGTICPVCGRELTVGVLHRIEELRQQNNVALTEHADEDGVKWQIGANGSRFVNLVPLLEIIAESSGVGVNSKKVKTIYEQMIEQLGSELSILLERPVTDITRTAGERIGKAIQKVRSRDIVIQPGFDGEYGKVAIWGEGNVTKNEQFKMI